MAAQEVHHRVPQCLLGFRDAADAGEMDGAGLQVWLNYEMEAMLWVINPDIERNELAALIEDSTVLLSPEEHRYGPENDFVRWGRRGGLATLKRYGTSWFSLLAKRRWQRLSGAKLEQVFASINEGRS